MARYFFFGTLMDDTVRRLVVGRRPVEPGFLMGFQRFYAPRGSYPVLVPASEEAVIKGLLVDGINAKAARRLELFEGPEYRAELLTIRRGAPNGESIQARAFQTRPGVTHRPKLWDYGAWQRRERMAYLERVRDWARRVA
ncbi:MAG: gamma-glutamylcyclotransferase family protein [Magnetovibrionaceae bacterium]